LWLTVTTDAICTINQLTSVAMILLIHPSYYQFVRSFASTSQGVVRSRRQRVRSLGVPMICRRSELERPGASDGEELRGRKCWAQHVGEGNKSRIRILVWKYERRGRAVVGFGVVVVVVRRRRRRCRRGGHGGRFGSSSAPKLIDSNSSLSILLSCHVFKQQTGRRVGRMAMVDGCCCCCCC
jgi:hypothetical protein